jgi:hypothetical protein
MASLDGDYEGFHADNPFLSPEPRSPVHKPTLPTSVYDSALDAPINASPGKQQHATPQQVPHKAIRDTHHPSLVPPAPQDE